MKGHRSTVLARALVVLVVVAQAFGAAGAQSGRAAAPARDDHTMAGMVTSVDVRARHVHVVIGTGLALRIVVFYARPDCTIRVSGAAATLDDLERGAPVAVRYERTAERYEAVAIVTPAVTPPAGAEP